MCSCTPSTSDNNPHIPVQCLILLLGNETLRQQASSRHPTPLQPAVTRRGDTRTERGTQHPGCCSKVGWGLPSHACPGNIPAATAAHLSLGLTLGVLLSACSVARKPGVCEVIVVDGGSSDRTAQLARASGAKVRLGAVVNTLTPDSGRAGRTSQHTTARQ